ncbi:hypothetical protein [Virgibacillus halodenitrificans]|uniref:Uncharacterized protein n=1 Tax=Virgibacillus halodenitrificans TaxID=1482 RepID=A0ABR7VQU6_VIRHA|nr:hypothetical protein [Virgibacillus halodenitrificans]MBD1222784.1 hypothetical protein [Virgibacillus halodenitrificans]
MENNKMDEMFNFWGVNSEENKQLLSFLISTEEDLSLFMEKYYTGEIVHNMRDFQQYKRVQYELSEDEFLAKFEENKKEALEELLQEPVSENMLGYMSKYSVTEKEIFSRYKEFPERSYINLIRGYQGSVKPSYDSLIQE